MSTEGRRLGPELRQDLQRCALSWTATVASTIALFAVLRGREWFIRALLIATAVSLIGLLWRLARLPAPILIVVQLAVGTGYLLHEFVPADVRYGVVPEREAWPHVWDLWSGGYSHLYHAPQSKGLDATPGTVLVLLTLVAAVAVSIDALAVSYRLSALAGAPMAGMYSVPAMSQPHRLVAWMFLPPALAFLLLLATDSQARLLSWGVPIGGRSATGAGRRGSSELSRMLRRIGLSVVSFALIVPLLLPKMTHNRVGTDGPDDDGTGKTITTADPLASLRRDLRERPDLPLLTMRTTSAHPSEEYLRSVTLDQFDGVSWTAGRRTVSEFTGLPEVLGLSPTVDTTPVDTEVTAEKTLRSDYLPMTFPATKVDVSKGWRLDELTVNVVSHEGKKQIAGLHWSVQSLDIAPTEKDVVNVAPTGDYLQKYLELPDNIPAVVKQKAEEVTLGAQNPLEIAAALQEWFRRPGNFTYDLKAAPGNGNNALLDFLRNRHGYCEQFAATMALMARQLGVPARVDVGFTAGQLAADGLSRTITTHDAHAWPELWIPNLGWTRFEPTPGSANSNPSAPSWLAALGKGVQPPDDNDQKNNDQNDKPQDATAGDGGDQGQGDGGGQAQPQPITVPCDPGTHLDKKTQLCAEDLAVWWKRWWQWELAAVAVLLLLAAPALVRELIRRRRWLIAGRSKSGSEVAEIAWLELGDTAVDLGIAWPAARTPRRTLAEVSAEARLTPEGRAALGLLGAAVERSRYAREALTGVDVNRMRTAVLVVATQLGVRAGRRRRFVAALAPASVWLTIRAGVGRFSRAGTAKSGRFRRPARSNAQ